MGNACPFPFDSSAAATNHWLSLAAIVGAAIILFLVAALLRARARIEHLEFEIEDIGNSLLRAGRQPIPKGDISISHIRSGKAAL